MLEFKVHQLEVAGRHYLLLPKLNKRQVGLLGERLARAGFSVNYGDLLTAKSSEGTVKVSPAGLCWSSIDPSDSVLPAIPALLATPRERISLGALKRMYFRAPKSRGVTTVHLSPRLESSPLWAKLRALDGCGLAPDEHSVASLFLNHAHTGCRMVTDFPADNPVPRIYGRKRYFDSKLDSAEAATTLRAVGERGVRNSYIRKDGTITLDDFVAPERLAWLTLFSELGEWCSFTPP